MSRPGNLKRRIEIQTTNQTESVLGGVIDDWQTTITTWCQVEEEKGVRALEYLQAKNERPYKITLRQDITINPNTMRFIYNGTPLIINSVEQDQDKYRYQIVSASEKIV